MGLDPERKGPEVRAHLGVVPQQDNLDEELTVHPRRREQHTTLHRGTFAEAQETEARLADARFAQILTGCALAAVPWPSSRQADQAVQGLQVGARLRVVSHSFLLDECLPLPRRRRPPFDTHRL